MLIASDTCVFVLLFTLLTGMLSFVEYSGIGFRIEFFCFLLMVFGVPTD